MATKQYAHKHKSVEEPSAAEPDTQKSTGSKNKHRKKFTRETFSGRWQMIREARLPDFYHTPGKDYVRNGGRHVSAPKKVMVAPHITKAVLLDLAQYDFEKSQVFKGVDNIAHSTYLSNASINKAMAVLIGAKILTRVRRGLNQTSVSKLDWDRIQSLREPFRPHYGMIEVTGEKEVPRYEDEVPEFQQPGDSHVVDEVNDFKAPTSEVDDDKAEDLVKLFLTYPVYSLKLSLPKLKRVAIELLRSHSLKDLIEAFNRLENWQKTYILRAKSPEAYLAAMLINEVKNSQPTESGDAAAADSASNFDDVADELRVLGIEDAPVGEKCSAKAGEEDSDSCYLSEFEVLGIED